VSVYPFIEAERARRHNVKRACVLLEVSRAAFYQWSPHVPSHHQRADEALRPKIKEIHEKSRGTYGSPRIHAALRRDGVATSTKRVARLMCEQGLAGRRKRRFKRTTVADPALTAAVDLLKRAFGPGTTVIDRAWCSDITYVRTWEGWLYVSAILDIGSRRVVGWAMADHMWAELPCQALVMAIEARRPEPGQTPRGSSAICSTLTAWPRASLRPVNAGTTPSPNRSGPRSNRSWSTARPGRPERGHGRRSSSSSRSSTTARDCTPASAI
jgi:transposase InsO family protein